MSFALVCDGIKRQSEAPSSCYAPVAFRFGCAEFVTSLHLWQLAACFEDTWLIDPGLRKLTMIGKVSLYIYMFLTTMELTTVIGSRSVIYYAS